MNWVDYAILICLGIGVLHGFRQGLVRLVVGFGALIVGFFAASWFHGLASAYLRPWIENPTTATILGWVLIFTGVILTGSLIASLIVRGLKLVGLSPIDRLLGAAFGGVQASLSLAIMAVFLMAFLPKSLPGAVNRSTLAPWVFGASKVLSAATPYEIRNGVARSYEAVRDKIDKVQTEGRKRLPLRED